MRKQGKVYEFSYEQVVDDLTRIAKERDPQRMGCYIYYVMKQYSDCPFVLQYEKNIDKVVKMVVECFGWNKRQVSEMKQYIHDFTKYIKKSD